jgi:cell division protease FtsH
MAGGYTRFLPDEESHYRTRSMFRDQLCTALGGHAAEELIFGEASTGPSNDIEQVTRIARSMVTRWGMSERLGPRTFGKTDEMVFLGREISETRNYSEKIAEEIDDEVRRLIEEAQERARNVLREHRAILDKLANALVQVETLEGDQLNQLLDSDPNEPWPPPSEKKDETPPVSRPQEEQPRRPAFEPKPAPGLAWESGNQASLDGGGRGPDPLT